MLTILQQGTLKQIIFNQPIYSGDLISTETGRELIQLGLCMKYECEYVLTNKGMILCEELFQTQFPINK